MYFWNITVFSFASLFFRLLSWSHDTSRVIDANVPDTGSFSPKELAKRSGGTAASRDVDQRDADDADVAWVASSTRYFASEPPWRAAVKPSLFVLYQLSLRFIQDVSSTRSFACPSYEVAIIRGFQVASGCPPGSLPPCPRGKFGRWTRNWSRPLATANRRVITGVIPERVRRGEVRWGGTFLSGSRPRNTDWE